MNAQIIERTEEDYNLYLSNIFMNVVIVNEDYPPGEAFKKVDLERYKKQFSEWSDSHPLWECEECGTLYKSDDDAESCCENYQCYECDSWWPDEEDAGSCCQNYQCEKCEEWHQQESDAHMCCRDYYCEECGEEYYTQEEVDNCCPEGYECDKCGNPYPTKGEALVCGCWQLLK